MNDNLWTRCNNCQRILYKQDILDNCTVCPACNFHFRISSTERLRLLFDDGRYELLDEGIYPVDFLGFEDSQRYAKRLEDSQAKSGLPDAIQTGRGTMGGIPVLILSMEFGFMGGSVASVVGEKITRACERAIAERLPVVIVSYKDRDEDRLAGLEAGANYYLTKSSFHDDTFIQAVREMIGNAEA
jgi:acetyl-CoA carboxylase carboxyl transferase subunit beta